MSLTPSNASVVAQSLYGRLVADQELAHFFDGSDMGVQASRMADALSNAHRFQEPASRDRLVAAHHVLRSRGLTTGVIGHLGAAMTEYEFTAEISALLDVFLPFASPCAAIRRQLS